MVRSWAVEHQERYRLAYALPGLIAWIVIGVAVFGLLAYPRSWISITALFMAYFIFRMVVTMLFYFIGRVHIRNWEKTDWASNDTTAGPAGFAPADVHHVVIVPNYKEPVAILERTLDALAVQHRAAERIIAVLAMEEREANASEKAEAIAAKYADAFKEILVTVHPAELPGEVPGKAGNQSWAAVEACALLEQRGVAIERVTVTSCDADSVMHPKYFEALSHLFAHDEKRYSQFWQAPLFYDNNIWQVAAPVRFTAWLGHAGQLAELAMPFYDSLPISTYTLSLKTAAECGFWDPMVISEDWHSYLNVMFEREGDVGLTSVFLPTLADAVDGDGFFSGMKNRHEQVMRHSWGAEDAGFILARMIQQRWWSPSTIFRFGQVLHDHVMRSAGWFLIVSTYLLLPHAQPLYTYELTRTIMVHPGVPFLRDMFTVGAFSLVTVAVIELIRTPPPSRNRPLATVLEMAACWMTLPIIGFYLGTLPAMRAQTRLMLGMPFYFKVTPKREVQEVPT